MKIITPGKLPEPRPFWWHGKKIKCPNCGCTAELEPGDKIDNETTERRIGGLSTATINCPTAGCGAVIAFSDQVWRAEQA